MVEKIKTKIGINLLFLIPGDVGGTESHSFRLLKYLLVKYHQNEWVVFINQETQKEIGKNLPIGDQVRYVYCNLKARNRFFRVLYEQLIFPLKVKKEKVRVLWSWGNTSLFFFNGYSAMDHDS